MIAHYRNTKEKRRPPQPQEQDASQSTKMNLIYFSDSGSDRFFGVFLFRYATIFCAAAGTGTTPLKTMS